MAKINLRNVHKMIADGKAHAEFFTDEKVARNLMAVYEKVLSK